MLPLIARDIGFRKKSDGSLFTPAQRNRNRDFPHRFRIPIGNCLSSSGAALTSNVEMSPSLVGGLILVENVSLKNADERERAIWHPHHKAQDALIRNENEKSLNELSLLEPCYEPEDGSKGSDSVANTPSMASFELFCGSPIWRQSSALIFLPTYNYSLDDIYPLAPLPTCKFWRSLRADDKNKGIGAMLEREKRVRIDSKITESFTSIEKLLFPRKSMTSTDPLHCASGINIPPHDTKSDVLWLLQDLFPEQQCCYRLAAVKRLRSQYIPEYCSLYDVHDGGDNLGGSSIEGGAQFLPDIFRTVSSNSGENDIASDVAGNGMTQLCAAVVGQGIATRLLKRSKTGLPSSSEEDHITTKNKGPSSLNGIEVVVSGAGGAGGDQKEAVEEEVEVVGKERERISEKSSAWCRSLDDILMEDALAAWTIETTTTATTTAVAMTDNNATAQTASPVPIGTAIGTAVDDNGGDRLMKHGNWLAACDMGSGISSVDETETTSTSGNSMRRRQGKKELQKLWSGPVDDLLLPGGRYETAFGLSDAAASISSLTCSRAYWTLLLAQQGGVLVKPQGGSSNTDRRTQQEASQQRRRKVASSGTMTHFHPFAIRSLAPPGSLYGRKNGMPAAGGGLPVVVKGTGVARSVSNNNNSNAGGGGAGRTLRSETMVIRRHTERNYPGKIEEEATTYSLAPPSSLAPLLLLSHDSSQQQPHQQPHELRSYSRSSSALDDLFEGAHAFSYIPMKNKNNLSPPLYSTTDIGGTGTGSNSSTEGEHEGHSNNSWSHVELLTSEMQSNSSSGHCFLSTATLSLSAQIAEEPTGEELLRVKIPKARLLSISHNRNNSCGSTRLVFDDLIDDLDYCNYLYTDDQQQQQEQYQLQPLLLQRPLEGSFEAYMHSAMLIVDAAAETAAAAPPSLVPSTVHTSSSSSTGSASFVEISSVQQDSERIVTPPHPPLSTDSVYGTGNGKDSSSVGIAIASSSSAVTPNTVPEQEQEPPTAKQQQQQQRGRKYDDSSRYSALPSTMYHSSNQIPVNPPLRVLDKEDIPIEPEVTRTRDRDRDGDKDRGGNKDRDRDRDRDGDKDRDRDRHQESGDIKVSDDTQTATATAQTLQNAYMSGQKTEEEEEGKGKAGEELLPLSAPSLSAPGDRDDGSKSASGDHAGVDTGISGKENANITAMVTAYLALHGDPLSDGDSCDHYANDTTIMAASNQRMSAPATDSINDEDRLDAGTHPTSSLATQHSSSSNADDEDTTRGFLQRSRQQDLSAVAGLRILVSETFIETRSGTVSALAAEHGIICIDAPLETPIDIIVDNITAVCIITMETASDRQKLKPFVRDLTHIAYKFRRIWVVILLGDDGNVGAGAELTHLYAAVSQFPSQIVLRVLPHCDLDLSLFHICCDASTAAALAAKEYTKKDSAAYLCRPFLDTISMHLPFREHCEFLQLFPAMNFFQAGALLSTWPLKVLVTLSAADIIDGMSKSDMHTPLPDTWMIGKFVTLLRVHSGLQMKEGVAISEDMAPPPEGDNRPLPPPLYVEDGGVPIPVAPWDESTVEVAAEYDFDPVNHFQQQKQQQQQERSASQRSGYYHDVTPPANLNTRAVSAADMLQGGQSESVIPDSWMPREVVSSYEPAYTDSYDFDPLRAGSGYALGTAQVEIPVMSAHHQYCVGGFLPAMESADQFQQQPQPGQYQTPSQYYPPHHEQAAAEDAYASWTPFSSNYRGEAAPVESRKMGGSNKNSRYDNTGNAAAYIYPQQTYPPPEQRQYHYSDDPYNPQQSLPLQPYAGYMPSPNSTTTQQQQQYQQWHPRPHTASDQSGQPPVMPVAPMQYVTPPQQYRFFTHDTDDK